MGESFRQNADIKDDYNNIPPANLYHKGFA